MSMHINLSNFFLLLCTVIKLATWCVQTQAGLFGLKKTHRFALPAVTQT
jgi:hypothetical protein